MASWRTAPLCICTLRYSSGGAAASHLANLRLVHHGDESPAFGLTRYFCSRGLEQPTS
jgi:hypothetical protein